MPGDWSQPSVGRTSPVLKTTILPLAAWFPWRRGALSTVAGRRSHSPRRPRQKLARLGACPTGSLRPCLSPLRTSQLPLWVAERRAGSGSRSRAGRALKRHGPSASGRVQAPCRRRARSLARRLHGVTFAGRGARATCVIPAERQRKRESGPQHSRGVCLWIPALASLGGNDKAQRLTDPEQQAVTRRHGDLRAQEAVGLPPAFAGVDPPTAQRRATGCIDRQRERMRAWAPCRRWPRGRRGACTG
jgi:hypothetical protein